MDEWIYEVGKSHDHRAVFKASAMNDKEKQERERVQVKSDPAMENLARVAPIARGQGMPGRGLLEGPVSAR